MPSEATGSTTPAPRLLRAGWYAGVVLAAVFLVVSILSWNVVLGLLALVLALLLFRNVDVVGGLPEGRDPADRRTPAGPTRSTHARSTTDPGHREESEHP